MANRLKNRTVLAGAALIVLGAGAALFLIASRSGAALTQSATFAAIGEAKQASLTVELPPAIADAVVGGPGTAGRPIVIIDPGHGGADPGATSVSGQVSEKQLTLVLGRELRDELVRRGRVRVAMTRDDDRYLSLEDRAAAARRVGASLFVSLHMDSAPNPLARGASVYSLSDVASDAEAARFADTENGHNIASGQDGGPVRAMLSDLAMRTQMSASADMAARLVNKSAGRFMLRPEPHRFASFHVLRRAETPAILFEAGYLSNADDELLLRSPEHRAAIVTALAQAIEADIATHARR